MEKIKTKDLTLEVKYIIPRGSNILEIKFPQSVDLSSFDLSSIEVLNEHDLLCATFIGYSTIYSTVEDLVKLSNDGSVYVEPIIPEPIPEPEPHVPTEEELFEIARQEKIAEINLQIANIDSEFASLDYVGIKIATGRATVLEYESEISRMNELAITKDNLLTQLNTL